MESFLEEPVYNENTTQAGADPYPAKPFPEPGPRSNQTLKFTISILLFGAIYYFFVSKDVAIIFWLVVIVFIHELGHYLAMKIFKYEDLTIFFIPLVGAVAGGSKETISQKEKSIVLLAGPVPGIVIGLALYAASSYFDNYALLRLSYAFVLINVLNLLPVYPLDGGQLLKTLFLGSRQLLTTIFIVASIVLLTGYAIANKEWFLLIVSYFLVTRMIQERQLIKIRKELKRNNIEINKPYGSLTNAEYWQIRDVVVSEKQVLAGKIVKQSHVVADNEHEVISFIKSVLNPHPLKDLSFAGKTIFLLVWITAILLPIKVMTGALGSFLPE